MDTELNMVTGSDADIAGNYDCANSKPANSEKNLEAPDLGHEHENGDTKTSTVQATLATTSTTEKEGLPSMDILSLSSVTETKTTKRQADAILEVAEQTTAYNVQVSSNNPATIQATATALQPGQGGGSMIVIEQPDQVIIQENMRVKNSSKVQVGQNNVISSALTDNSQGSPLVGATAAVSPPQLVIRKPGKVFLYSRKDIDSCDAVQLGDNNVMGKLIPQEDAFVKTCIKLGIDPKQKEDIFKRLGDDEIRQQFSTMMAEKCSIHCKLRNAGDGCILLELEVPTEEDRLQLLRMARDGTFQQVLLETFLPEFAAEGRAVNMNLAIGVRNPSQAMVEELQGATASSDYEDVVVVEIPVATNNPSASKQDQLESAEDSLKKSDEMEDAAKDKELPAGTDATMSKPVLYVDDVPTPSPKLLSEADEGEEEITVSVEGYAEAVALGTGATAADFPQDEFDDKFLTCDICQNIYNDPRILPCHHTFCARCLGRWCKGQHQLTCPTCRQEVGLKEAGVSSLPPNFHINKLIDFRAQQSRKEAYAQCQICESGARVQGSCRECHFFLCKNCITIHGKTPVLKDHHITLLDSPTEYCPKHDNQPIAFYCQPCGKLVCQDCAITEHQSGPDHDLQEVSKAAQEYKVALQTLVGETENKLKGTDYILRKEVTSLRTHCELQRKEIQKHFVQLREKLDKEEQEMTNKLKEMEMEQEEPLLQETKALEKTSKSIEDRLTFCQDILIRGNDAEILTLGQQLKYDLNHVKNKEITHRGLDYCMVFETTRDMENLKCSPGRLVPGNLSSIKVTELPIECLPTTIMVKEIRWGHKYSLPTPQVTVVSPDQLEDWYSAERIYDYDYELPEERCDILNTTRITDKVTEAVWRPQTSGTHLVGTSEACRRQGYRSIQFIPVDVASNNPVLRFGQKGSQHGQFDRPRDVAVRGDKLYVADTLNNRIQVFDLSGNASFSFPTTANLASLAVQIDGTIVVNCNEEVMKFSPSGELLHKFPLGEHCISPYGLAVQRGGRVVVVEPGKHSIFLFEADGTLVKQVGGLGKREGQFNRPCFVSVDKEDNIIVADTGNCRVQVFDKDLTFKYKFGTKGRKPQDMCYPMGMSADSWGNIVLANIGDTIDGVVQGPKLQVFHLGGTWVSTISSAGDKLNLPHGVAVTEDGHVFVADTKDHCIRKYRYM